MPHGGTKVDHTVLYVIVAGKENIGGRFAAYKYGVIYADTTNLGMQKCLFLGFFNCKSCHQQCVCIFTQANKKLSSTHDDIPVFLKMNYANCTVITYYDFTKFLLKI